MMPLLCSLGQHALQDVPRRFRENSSKRQKGTRVDLILKNSPTLLKKLSKIQQCSCWVERTKNVPNCRDATEESHLIREVHAALLRTLCENYIKFISF